MMVRVRAKRGQELENHKYNEITSTLNSFFILSPTHYPKPLLEIGEVAVLGSITDADRVQ